MSQKFSKKLLITAISLAFTGILTGCQTTSPLSSNNQTTDHNVSSHQVTPENTQVSTTDGRHEYMLDNGLKVIIKEDHRSPIAITQVWYEIGSTDEPVDKGGISHLLEHLMFQGTDKVSGDDYDALVEKFGGELNAFTSFDYTGYYELLPANRLGLALELEADRMVNLTFKEDMFKKEHQVVMEERRQRIDTDPLGPSYEAFRKQILPDSPRGESVIGPMDELESITLDELKEWYRIWYAPNNATLVIVGDVDPDDAIKKVKKYFAHIKPSALPERPSVTQKAFRGYERTHGTAPVNVPVVMMGFTLPTLNSAKYDTQTPVSEDTVLALSLLTSVLDNGYSDRLETRLVRGKEVLASVGSGYDAFARGNTWFWIEANPREGISLEEAENAIFNEVEKLKNEPITQQEIERAKTKTITSLIYEQDSVSGQASSIGSMQVNGLDDRMLDTLPQKLDRITPEFMQQVAKKYLSKNNLEVMYVTPQEPSK